MNSDWQDRQSNKQQQASPPQRYDLHDYDLIHLYSGSQGILFSLHSLCLLINNSPRSLENRSRGQAPQTEAEPMVLGARSLYEVFLEVRRRSRRRQVLSDAGDCDRKTPTS